VLKSVREKFARIKDFVNPQEMEMKESIKVSERTSLLRVRRFPKEPPIKVSERNPPPSWKAFFRKEPPSKGVSKEPSSFMEGVFWKEHQ
jgi:hypothetical protein